MAFILARQNANCEEARPHLIVALLAAAVYGKESKNCK